MDWSRTLGRNFQDLEHKGVNYLQTYCVKFGWITLQKICSQDLKSPVKVLTTDLLPSFACSVFTSQNCTGPSTAAVGGYSQMRPFLKRLKQSGPFPNSKAVVNMTPHLHVFVPIGEETTMWVSEAFRRIQREKSKFPVSSSIFPLCLLWWRWTELMQYLQCCWECPEPKEHIGAREVLLQNLCCGDREQQGTHGFPWQHSSAGTPEALGVTELLFLEGIQYSWSKILLRGTKKHKGSAPSFNNFNFPLFPVFHGPAYRSYINCDPLPPAKQASSLTSLSSPAFFQSSPLIIHFLPCSMHQLSPLLKSSLLSLLSNPPCQIPPRKMLSDQPQVKKAH